MRFIISICRLLVGLLFIFSGFIKSNDSVGFSYKLEEYFDVFAQDLRPVQDTFKSVIQLQEDHFIENKEVLYHFDTKKYISIERKKGQEVLVDTNVLIPVDLNLENNSGELLNIAIMLRDSSEVVPVTILGMVGNKEVFKKQVLIDNISFSDFYEEVDVSSHIKRDPWYVSMMDWLKSKALFLSILICILEIVFGIAIIIGWKPKLISWLMLLMIVFFTFLTWYSATYNKVTDCGCFGDALKLTPWESFYKDVVLLVLIVVIWLARNRINLFFSKSLTAKIVGIFTVLSIAFSLYCVTYLPVIDFLNFAEGKDIVKDGMTYPEGARQQDLIEIHYLYEVNGKEFPVVYNTETSKYTPPKPDGAKFIKVIKEEVKEKAYKLPIHDFENIFNDVDGDVSQKMLQEEGYQLWVVAMNLEEASEEYWQEIGELTKPLVKKGVPVYGLTSSPLNFADELKKNNKLKFSFYNADQTLLKSMIRSNPGIILLKGTLVKNRWSRKSIPDYDKIKRIMK